MKQHKILGICGSLRQRSNNFLALKAAGKLMPETIELRWVTTLSELPMYNSDIEDEGFPESTQRLRDLVAEADGLLISTPEHNWTMSASLKNAIDWLSRFDKPDTPFHRKPCAILSATSGPLGGARVQYDVRRSITGLGGLFLVKPEIFIGIAPSKFDEAGNLSDNVTVELLRAQMQAFSFWISDVKARETGEAPAR